MLDCFAHNLQHGKKRKAFVPTHYMLRSLKYTSTFPSAHPQPKAAGVLAAHLLVRRANPHSIRRSSLNPKAVIVLASRLTLPFAHPQHQGNDRSHRTAGIWNSLRLSKLFADGHLPAAPFPAARRVQGRGSTHSSCREIYPRWRMSCGSRAATFSVPYRKAHTSQCRPLETPPRSNPSTAHVLPSLVGSSPVTSLFCRETRQRSRSYSEHSRIIMLIF